MTDKSEKRKQWLADAIHELQVAIKAGKFPLCHATIQRIIDEYQNELKALKKEATCGQ